MSSSFRCVGAVLVCALLFACGGGGGGPDSGSDPVATPSPTEPPGPDLYSLDPDDVVLLRHFQRAHSFSIQYPDFWTILGGWDDRPPEPVVTFRQIQRLNDPYREQIEVRVVARGDPTLDLEISNITEISTREIVANGLVGHERIFDGELAHVKVGMRFAESTFDVGDQTLSILLSAEREFSGRKHDGFDDHLDIYRIIVESFDLGFDIIKLSGVLDPGRPAIASNGQEFISVACRDYDSSYYGGELVARIVQNGNERVGPEIRVDEGRIPCREVSPTVTWDGTNFLIAYVREHTFMVSENGQTIRRDKEAIVAKRVSRYGDVVDVDPILISTEDQSRGTHDPVSVFDGSRHLVVWNQITTDNGGGDIDYVHQFHAAFVNPDGTVSPKFVLFDRLVGQYGTVNYYAWRANLAAASDRIMVVWGPRSEPTVAGEPRPIYGQIIDLNGNAMLTEPLLIRSDGNKQPRYPRVVFDGSNFVVAWIQGELSSNTLSGGYHGIFARRVSLAGDLLDGDSDTDGVELMPEVVDNKEFLEVVWSGSGFYVFWGVRVGSIPEGVKGTFVTPDLSAIEPARFVWGAGTRGPEPDYLAVARNGSGEVVTLWAAGYTVEGWFLEPSFPD